MHALSTALLVKIRVIFGIMFLVYVHVRENASLGMAAFDITF